MAARSTGFGLWFALASAATFGSSGPFAKSLLVEGWSSGAIVLLRVAGATLVLAVPTILALRGRWFLVRENLLTILAYGAVAVAGCQVAYFYAVQRLDVGVALLLEYLGVVLAVVGLVLVLDLSGQSRPDLVGVAWGLVAATGLATFFVLAAEDSTLPPVALAGLGMAAGSVALGILGAVHVIPLEFAATPVTLVGGDVPWWVAIGELALIAAAAAYLLGVTAARMLGSTVASFVGLTEVLFAVLFAWVLLDELPGLVQLAGGVCIVAGVVAVRLGELRRGRPEQGPAAAEDADFPLPAGVA